MSRRSLVINLKILERNFLFFFLNKRAICVFSFTSTQWSCLHFPLNLTSCQLGPFLLLRLSLPWQLKLETLFKTKVPRVRATRLAVSRDNNRNKEKSQVVGGLGRVLISCWALYLRTVRQLQFQFEKKQNFFLVSCCC